MSGDARPLLRVAGVRKAYGPNVVLDDVHLDVARHEVVVLIGASGSCKSTLTVQSSMLIQALASLARHPGMLDVPLGAASQQPSPLIMTLRGPLRSRSACAPARQ